MMMFTPDELIAGFPHSSPPKVTGEPTSKYLKIVRLLLNTDTIRISSYKRVGLHGHLGLIVITDKYFAVATDVFHASANPGSTATIVMGMTKAQITETNIAHT
jgi:hypothetical protein